MISTAGPRHEVGISPLRTSPFLQPEVLSFSLVVKGEQPVLKI